MWGILFQMNSQTEIKIDAFDSDVFTIFFFIIFPLFLRIHINREAQRDENNSEFDIPFSIFCGC
jgi:hypothetical protein